MPRREYSDDTKAAVMAALLAGQSINEVAKSYSIPRGTVANWAGQTGRKQLDATTKKEALGELILVYLQENLCTLAVQSKHFRDLTWLKKQPASELAVLHGVIADKTIRILAALEPISDANDGTNSAA